MGKFRSKLKRHTKGKSWAHGQSATSNPENKKHRMKARSRFFQPNLNTNAAAEALKTDKKSNALTLEAILKHDARQSYAAGKKPTTEPTVNDIATSLKSFNIMDVGGEDENMSESQAGTFKTFNTFASNYSACTNMSFSKLLNGFRQDSPLHKEMLAILAALTDVIKERGGTQTSTEYFLALMETIDAANEDSETIASVTLLSMGIKTVPESILRKKFSDSANLLVELMKRFVDTDNQNVLRSIIGCMSVLLRAQEYSVWSSSSTLEYFDTVLSFTIHSKPKVRKSAQHAISSIIHGSCFMSPATSSENAENVVVAKKQVPSHPAAYRVAKFCVQQFKPENIANAHTIILHTLGLLRDTLNGFKTDDIKFICEHLLSIMTAANVLIRTNCFQVLHTLFLSKSQNLSSNLIGKLISAIYDYRPDKSDARQLLAWLTVLKQAHICLATKDLKMAINSVPRLIECCASDLWMSERSEIVNGTSNTIKEIFTDCISLVCENERLADVHRSAVTNTIQSITKALDAPFGLVVNQVVLIFSTVFQITGRYFADVLIEPLGIIGGRYDAESSFRLQIEHAVLAAIPTMGPNNVLKAIPLADITTWRISVERSWILPLLREAITESTIEFFVNYILKLASQCNGNWKKYKAENNMPLAHTYELLCCQLWGLFPGFCRKPSDIQNFRYVAKTLGAVLNENPELRAPVLDGLKELLTNVDDDGKNELSKYAKNFLPRLFNIYSTKPTGTYENELRTSAMEVIRAYLKITPKEVLNQMFDSAKEQHKSLDAGSFIAESIVDIIENLALYQSTEQLTVLYDDFISPVLQKQRKSGKPGIAKTVEKLKKQQRKAYQLLYNVLISENEGCQTFVANNLEKIETLVLTSLRTTCNTTQAARLKCLNVLIEKRQDDISLDSGLISKTIPEVLVAFNHGSNKKDNIALNLIIQIGEIYQKENKLNSFIDIMMAGFGGDTVLISNTILALKAVVTHFTGSLTVNTLQFILEQILSFLVGKSRNEVEAAVAFLIIFIKVLPSPLVANHLTTIVRSLSSMVPDTKRYCRIHIGYILKKLCKKFTAEEIIKLVPGNDEVTHKKLKNIRKEQNREKRQKLSKESNDDAESDDDLASGLEAKSHTIDDILGDSDSDFDDDMNDNEPKSKQKNKKRESYIQEDADTILDLADISSIGKITSTKPTSSTTNSDSSSKKKSKDSNRGFKMAQDGRLIISEPKRGENVSDSDDDIIDNGVEKKPSMKRSLDDDSDESDVDMGAASRKRQALGARSMASGKTGTSSHSKYVTGGKGIHRPNAAASVRSGVSMATTKSASTAYGSSFKAKKAKGDMKKKGKMDPYAYIPLSRNVLNKRKRSKNTGQFKGLVAGARNGAAAGSKQNRVTKTYRKPKK